MRAEVLDDTFVESTPPGALITHVALNNPGRVGIPGVARLTAFGVDTRLKIDATSYGGLCVESMIGPSATIQYLCVSDDHIRLGMKVRDGEGHLTIRDGRWAYCSADRKDEPHKWEAILPTSFTQVRHSSIMRRSGHAGDQPQDARDEERSE